MKKLIAAFLMLATMNAGAQWGHDTRMLNSFIVMLHPGHSAEQLLMEQPSLKIQRCLSPRMNIWLLERNTGQGADDFLLQLRGNSHVKLAQFDHHVKQRALIPDDASFGQQWDMMNTGQGGGVAGADIQAPEAWDINHSNVTANGDTIVVAVVDGLFDLNHEDIAYFINYNEIPGNGVDDDLNGFIDDVSGWNVPDTNGNVNTTSPLNSHSTHLAGTVGAIGNNNIGIAGVCWGAKILPINYGLAQESYVVAAYDYAREMRILYDATFGTKGAFVVSANSSFGLDGGPGGYRHADFPIWCAMFDSMGAVGILSVAATANSGWNVDENDDVPTGCPNVFLISVTNTTRGDVRNTGAGYGKTTIDLGAPGTGIYSTVPQNNYFTQTGTSMAAPHVAGTIAAMYAAACKGMLNLRYERPDSVALLMKQYLMDAAEWISSLNNITVSNGRLNLLRSIQNLRRFNCDSCNFNAGIQKVDITCHGANNGALAATVTGNPDGYTYQWSNGLNTVECLNQPAGFYILNVTDSSGCRRTSTAELHNPDTILITNLHIVNPTDSAPGNIILTAAAGNDSLLYSIDGINYQTASLFSISTAGNYTIYIKSQTGCVAQQQVIVAGVNDPAAFNLAVKLYPNPANNVLNISSQLSGGATLGFSITDQTGRLVYTANNYYTGGSFVQSISTAAFSAGVYFITITSQQSRYTGRFIISK